MTEFDSDMKILFLHGLESGPNGKKARYIMSNFPLSLCPDLHMSVYRPDRANGIVRSALEVLWDEPTLLFTDRSRLAAKAAMLSLEKCAEVGRLHLNPSVKVLCGSSWGGAVAIWMMVKGLWKGRTILIAPALKRVLFHGLDRTPEIQTTLNEFYQKLLSEIDADTRSRVLVIHGTKDDTIPLSDSMELCDKLGFRLIQVPEGDHSLNEYLLNEGLLARLLIPGENCRL